MQLGSSLHIPVQQDSPLRPPQQIQPQDDALARQQQPSAESNRPQRRVIETLSAERPRNNIQNQFDKDDVSSPRIRQALDSFTQIESFSDTEQGVFLEGIDIKV